MPGSQFNEPHQAYAIKPSLSFFLSEMVLGAVLALEYYADGEILNLYMGGGLFLLGGGALVIRMTLPSFIVVGATKIELPSWMPGQTVTVHLHQLQGFRIVSEEQETSVYFELKDGKKYSFKSNSITKWDKLRLDLFEKMPCLDEQQMPHDRGLTKVHQIYLLIISVALLSLACFVDGPLPVRLYFGGGALFCLLSVAFLKKSK